MFFFSGSVRNHSLIPGSRFSSSFLVVDFETLTLAGSICRSHIGAMEDKQFLLVHVLFFFFFLFPSLLVEEVLYCSVNWIQCMIWGQYHAFWIVRLALYQVKHVYEKKWKYDNRRARRGGRRCYDPDAPISEDVGNRAIEQNNSTSASLFSRIITSSIIKIKDHQAQGLSRKVLEYFHWHL